ncbi:MAG: hypothetical protein M3P11_08510 [Actinomycetota bacterium]|nr:hypothetical protein [Actinomycetota bacterium]
MSIAAEERVSGRWFGLIAGLLALGIDGLYINVIRLQGSSDLRSSRFLFVASYIGIAAVVAWFSAAVDLQWRALALASATGAFGSLVLVGAASIGVLFLPSLILCIVGWRRCQHMSVQSTQIVAAIAAPALIAVGLFAFRG